MSVGLSDLLLLSALQHFPYCWDKHSPRYRSAKSQWVTPKTELSPVTACINLTQISLIFQEPEGNKTTHHHLFARKYQYYVYVLLDLNKNIFMLLSLNTRLLHMGFQCFDFQFQEEPLLHHLLIHTRTELCVNEQYGSTELLLLPMLVWESLFE